MRAPEGDRRELDLAAGGEQEPPLITPSASGPSVCHECERLGRSRKASESVETDEVQERTSRLLDLDEGNPSPAPTNPSRRGCAAARTFSAAFGGGGRRAGAHPAEAV